jgi:pyrroloquinoline quinone (PQQ) biosynthesis protein C
MIQFLAMAKHNLGSSSVWFAIDNYIYEYHADSCHVDKCEKLSRHSIKRALNYIKKHSVKTIKSMR